MRIQEVKKISAFIFMVGFLLGIIFVNLFARQYVLTMGIFSDMFLEEYSGSNIQTYEYMAYIMKLRGIPLLTVAVLGNTRFRKITGGITLLWTGVSSGIILTAAVIKMSIKGLVLCLVGILPHFICYAAAYIMLIMYFLTYPEIKWNLTKTISLILFMFLGIISECYINPVILDIYIDFL